MKNPVILKLILLVCFFVALIYFFSIPIKPDPSFQWTMFILIFISTPVFFILHKKKYGVYRWISISPIFILGYFIVFFQMILLNLLGFEVPDLFYDFIWADESVINKSFAISTLGLLAYYIGVSFTRNHIISFKKKLESDSVSFLLIISYLFYILFFLTAGSYVTGEYTANDGLALSTYFYKLFKISLSAAIILKVSKITSLKYNKLSFVKYLSYFSPPLLILLGWHLVFSLFVGDRGPVIYFSLLAFSIYFIRWKRLNLIKIVVSLFILSTFLTLIGEVRQSRFSGVGYSERVISAFSSIGESDKKSKNFDTAVPGSQTVELALSVRTLNHAIYNVPDKYEYNYGLFQFKHFYSIIPGLSGIMTELLYDGEIKYDGSSNFITYLIQGEHPKSGEGSSVVADFYLDFGVVGVVLGLFFFGVFVGKNEFKLFLGYQRPTLLWVATSVFLSLALYLNRSAILFELSNIILIYILIKINSIIVANRRIT